MKFKLDFKRFLIVLVVLMVFWLSFIFLLANYGKELRTHPCNICAEQVGDDIICYSFDSSIVFTPEGDIKPSLAEVKWDNKKF